MSKIYKVGGSVRDKLLGEAHTDNDYVVVGSSVSEMQNLGFKMVGKDFPVFLHPITREEYALARCEKKTGLGHQGFKFSTLDNITLEDDLKRRDFTINAIAETEDGQLIDPFNGIHDLHKKTIRHVSDAFVEDPLRVLRGARLSAKLNFKIAKETLELMKQMATSGELSCLSKERIWIEVNKALTTKSPGKFFIILKQVNALDKVMPEFVPLIANHELWLQFINHLEQMVESDYTLDEKIALIYYYISQATPNLHIKQIIKSTNINRKTSDLAILFTSTLPQIAMFHSLTIDDISSLINRLDPFRKHNRYLSLIRLYSLISKTRSKSYLKPNLILLQQIIERFKAIDYTKFSKDNESEFIQQIKKTKLVIITQIMSTQTE